MLSFYVDYPFIVSSIALMLIRADKLLISDGCKARILSIHDIYGAYIAAFDIVYEDKLVDAIWTPDGNIIYTTWIRHLVVLMSDSGTVELFRQMALP